MGVKWVYGMSEVDWGGVGSVLSRFEVTLGLMTVIYIPKVTAAQWL